jgi:hypothetical protein
VIERVIAYGMAFDNNLLKYFWMLTNVFTNAKKSCFGIELLQCIQHKFSWAGYGAIIEREINFFGFGFHSP